MSARRTVPGNRGSGRPPPPRRGHHAQSQGLGDGRAPRPRRLL